MAWNHQLDHVNSTFFHMWGWVTGHLWKNRCRVAQFFRRCHMNFEPVNAWKFSDPFLEKTSSPSILYTKTQVKILNTFFFALKFFLGSMLVYIIYNFKARKITSSSFRLLWDQAPWLCFKDGASGCCTEGPWGGKLRVARDFLMYFPFLKGGAIQKPRIFKFTG